MEEAQSNARPPAAPQGLQNIGNTCFMNCVIQCLVRSPELREYFLRGSHETDKNLENPLGTKGAISTAFFDVLKSLQANPSPVVPNVLKRALEGKKAEFRGARQHDAHELLECLLDGLHEDLNRIKLKSYTPEPDEDERPLAVRADDAWASHRLRNDSIVADLFQGQYMSTLTCPECSYSSTRFDPFTSVTLPLPQPSRKLKVIHFGSERAVAFGVLVPLVGDIRGLSGLTGSHIRIAEVYQSKFQRIFEDTFRLEKIGNDDKLFAFDFEFCASSTVVPVLQLEKRQCPANVCTKCSKAQACNHCSRCYSVCYCSPDCQRADWPAHKSSCRAREAVPFAQPLFVAIPNDATYEVAFKRCVKAARPYVTPDHIPTLLRHINNFGHSAKPDISLGAAVPVVQLQCIAIEWTVGSPAPCTVPERPIVEHASVAAAIAEDSGATLAKAFDLFCAPEHLSSENTWYCRRCKSHTEATKQMKLWRAPSHLVVHLRRFSWKNILWQSKLRFEVDYPADGLSVDPFFAEGAPRGAGAYRLYGVVRHHGDIGGGHYTAVVREGEDWFVCDDDRCYPAQSSDIKSADAYILFYKLKQAEGP